MRISCLPLIAVLTTLITPSMVQAADIYVDTTSDVVDGGDSLTSLREAITQANTNAGMAVGVTTIHVPAGTYTVSIAGTDEDSNATGDFDLSGDAGNTTIIRGAGGGATIIDGAQLDRVLHVVSGSSVEIEIERLTIRNGRLIAASGASPSANGKFVYGGGVYMNGTGSFTLRDVVIEDCLIKGGDGAAANNVSGSGNQYNGVGGEGGRALGAGLSIDKVISGKTITCERVGFYRNIAQGGTAGMGGYAISTDGDAGSGKGGYGGSVYGGAVYISTAADVSVSFHQVEIKDTTATGGAAGNNEFKQTNAASGAYTYQAASGGSIYGTGLYLYSNLPGSTAVFKDLFVTGNKATSGAGGNGAYAQNSAAADGDITGEQGGFSGFLYGSGVYLYNTGHVHFVSGSISNNTATGGAAGNGGNKLVPGPANMTGGAGGPGGHARAAVYTGGSSQPAMHIQFDAAMTIEGNVCTGGAGGNGAAGANGGAPGNGGYGGEAKFPGLWIESATSLSTTGGGAVIAGNLVTGGAGGKNGVGVDAASGSIDATAFRINPAFTFYNVSGKAFADTGGADGLSTGEPGLAGVAIKLFDSNTKLVLDTSTTLNGTYAFATTWEAASTLKFTTPNFAGIPTTQDVGGDDTIDSDILPDGSVAVTITSDLTNIDAGYQDPGPITGTFALTISGKVSADVTKVSIGSTIVTPTNGTYTISVDVPASAGSVDLITTSSTGVQSKRTIVFDKAALPSG